MYTLKIIIEEKKNDTYQETLYHVLQEYEKVSEALEQAKNIITQFERRSHDK